MLMPREQTGDRLRARMRAAKGPRRGRRRQQTGDLHVSNPGFQSRASGVPVATLRRALSTSVCDPEDSRASTHKFSLPLQGPATHVRFWGVKQTSLIRTLMSANDPYRTSSKNSGSEFPDGKAG